MKKKKSPPRTYPPRDIKLLYGLAAGMCSFTDCRAPLIIKGTKDEKIGHIGIIAHIAAHSDRGPRANPSMSVKERDSYSNWILLCGTHHDLVDEHRLTYTSEVLHNMKNAHEEWVKTTFMTKISAVTFAELETCIQALIQSSIPSSTNINFDVTPLRRKLEKNNLSEKVERYIKIGLTKFEEVENYIDHQVKIDPNYPDRLSEGFVQEYNRLIDEGYSEDDLFFALHEFSCNYESDFDRKAAGLAVLVYFFHKCDVFDS